MSGIAGMGNKNLGLEDLSAEYRYMVARLVSLPDLLAARLIRYEDGSVDFDAVINELRGLVSDAVIERGCGK